MATQFEIDCALMAGRAYQTTRDPSGINWFPDPAGWTEFAHVPNSTYPTTSGFEAVAFQRGTEIVISFAGTNPNSLLDPDNDANIGLATGFGSKQLLQAAEYYLQVKAANPNATSITFTGHSLGGGLAALMGVFFGKNAVTFDQAPFANSAELNFFTPDVAANLKSNLLARGYSEADLSSLTNFLQLRESNGGIPNSNLITTLRVTGEFTSSTLPFRVYDAIGAETPLTHGPADWSGASFDLHSQSLLTTFVQNDQFRQVTFKLTDLLGMIFDDELFEHPTNDPNNENFLERLVRHQNGNAPGVATADAMLSRFTDDLWKLAQDGGLTMADDPASVTRFVSKTLTAFAMQMYYEDTANATNANKELFTQVTGGVQFDRADVDATLAHAKGYNLYFQNYLNSTAFTDNERQLIQSLLPTLRDWYVQAGSDGMTVADAENRGAFMLGGNGADNLTGGTLADLLVGNAGADTLDGGAGIDTLLGGAGNDMLRGGLGQDSVTGGAGNDQITLLVTAGNVDTIDAGAGSDTLVLSGVVPGNHVVRVDLSSSTDQVVSIGGVVDVLTQINFENLTASGLGSSVTVIGSAGANSIIGSNGNDSINGGAGNDAMTGGLGNDTLNGGLGQDSVTGGAGNDQITLLVTAGNVDTIDAGAGSDTLVLSGVVPGNHVVRVDLSSSTDQVVSIGGVADVLTQINFENLTASGLGSSVTVIGSAGANSIIGSNGNDSINGGAGNDAMTGGLGNDTLNGGLGQDSVMGGAGNDQITLLVTAGNVDTIDAGAGSDTLVLSGVVPGNHVVRVDLSSSTDQVVSIGGVADVLTQINFENLTASGLGSSVTVIGSAGANSIIGSNGNDSINGGAGNDAMTGGLGNDTLNGGLGQDSVMGGAGNDQITLLVTAGNVDTIDAGAGSDTLVLSGVVPGNHVVRVDLSSSTDQVVSIGGVADVLTQINFENLTASGLGSSVTVIGSAGANSIIGSNGNDSINGGAGNDAMTGGLGNDTLNGGDGNDTLNGGLGQDSVTGGAGNDQITLLVTAGNVDTIDAGAGSDTLVLSGVVPGNHVVRVDLSSSTDQVVSIGGVADVLTQINFENLTASGLGSSVTVIGSAGANSIIGSNGNDSINGGAGNDAMTGGLGNDTLNGGLGQDSVTGGAGNDQLNGGVGTDTLRGGLGNDIYRVNRNDGQDTISENDNTIGNSDTLLYGAAINPLDLVISRQANDLRLAIHGSSDQITVQNWYANTTTAQVETIQAGNGQTLLSTQVDQLIQAMATFTQQTGLSWDQGIVQQPQQVHAVLAANWQ